MRTSTTRERVNQIIAIHTTLLRASEIMASLPSNPPDTFLRMSSCRSINHEEDLEAAIQYAGDTQDRKHVEYEHKAQASDSNG
jgi:hypothetical protein